MKFSVDRLLEKLDLPAGSGRIWVAYSGGLDSSVLLHALAEARARLPGELAAVHVDHGLHPDSRQWEVFCRVQCKALGILFESARVDILADGESVEAAARDARYSVFRDLLEDGDVILTAQHEDDQVETFLLQALRGAGVSGLAGMPRESLLGHGRLLRPLLDVSRDALAEWAESRKLVHLNDPSNTDNHFDRNFLRNEILPLMKTRWPAAGDTLSRAATHCAEAMQLLRELALIDLEHLRQGDTALDLPGLLQLNAARRRNVIREWLRLGGARMPSDRKLDHILHDVLEAAPDSQPMVAWDEVAVRRYRNALYLTPAEIPPAIATGQAGRRFDLGEFWGVLEFESAEVGLPEGDYSLRFRQGGERIRPAGRKESHELKKLYQDAGVLPWLRAGVPLLYRGDQLAAVGDLWLADELLVRPGFRPVWREKPQLIPLFEPGLD